MPFKFIKPLVKIGLLSAVGGTAFYQISSHERVFKKAYNSFSLSSINPQTKWDDNWDHRAITSIVKPLKENATSEQENEYNQKLEKNRSKAIRHFILIRHGQYIYGDTDEQRKLTDVGREQASLTGKRINDLKVPIDNVVVSTMTRAQETANLILKQLPYGKSIERKDCKMMEEGAVFKPIPEIDYWQPDESEFFIDNARIEAAFRKYIHRAEPSQEKDSFTMLVCHGNVIRYFVCRALQLPPEAWLRFNLHHASITCLSVYPNGRVVVKYFGDCGFLPPKLVTLS